MIAFSGLELAISGHAFWKETGDTFRKTNARTTKENESRLKEATLKQPAARATWLCALFLLGHVGAEAGLGGWIVEVSPKDVDPYVRHPRIKAPTLHVHDAYEHAVYFASGMSAMGFWLGMTIGTILKGKGYAPFCRHLLTFLGGLVLGFVTPKIGEILAIMESDRASRVNNNIC